MSEPRDFPDLPPLPATEPTGPVPPGLPPIGPSAGPPTLDIGRYLRDAWAVIQPAWVEIWLTLLVLNVAVVLGFALCVVPGLLIMGPLWGGALLHMAKRMLGRPRSLTWARASSATKTPPCWPWCCSWCRSCWAS